MNEKSSLQNLLVLVTRPMPEGEKLCAALRVEGAHPTYLPTIEIVPLLNEKNLIKCMNDLDQYTLFIFTSPQAVFQSVALIKKAGPIFPKTLQVAAIGLGTAKALQSAGFISVIYPEEWSSEGFLALPLFQNLTGQRIAIFRGEGGRDLLAKQCEARGALVTPIVVYRRALPRVDDIEHYRELLQTQKIDIIVCTSGDGLRYLVHLMGADYLPLLQHTPLLVISERLIKLAKELQFDTVFLAANASHLAVIEALYQYKGNHDVSC
ncbi:MAG: hypothetical protein ACD_60C00025G0050 [uncultured bacterium]|nr:MAG: hypothetical protein ACD_60C00025G0050 [uncultured bacterium]